MTNNIIELCNVDNRVSMKPEVDKENFTFVYECFFKELNVSF